MQPTSTSTSRPGPFLARCVRWDWHDDAFIDILDDLGQPVATLDEWQTLVFYKADGSHSLEMILDWFPSQHQPPVVPPADYRVTISRAAQWLIDDRHWIERRGQPDDLDPKLAAPSSEQTENAP